MDDRTPSDPNEPGRPHTEVPVPDPHRGEPLPPPEEGMRPGVDPAVRPHQDEPLGPPAGLVKASGAQVEEEATPGGDPEAEALLAQMGVEEEGIESGQLLGLVTAVLVSIVALIVVLIYLFYIPYRSQVGAAAEGAAKNVDIQMLQTEARAKISQYTRTDSTYGVPIGRAMGLVAAEYGTGAGADLPESRQGWNTLAVTQGRGLAILNLPAQEGGEARFDTLRVGAPVGDGVEQVGVDRDVDTVELIENDGDLDADDAEALPDDIE